MAKDKQDDEVHQAQTPRASAATPAKAPTPAAAAASSYSGPPTPGRQILKQPPPKGGEMITGEVDGLPRYGWESDEQYTTRYRRWKDMQGPPPPAAPRLMVKSPPTAKKAPPPSPEESQAPAADSTKTTGNSFLGPEITPKTAPKTPGPMPSTPRVTREPMDVQTMWELQERPDDESHAVVGDVRISLRALNLDPIASALRHDILSRAATPRAAMKMVAHFGHRMATNPWDTPPGRTAEMFARAALEINRIGKYLQHTKELFDEPDAWE